MSIKITRKGNELKKLTKKMKALDGQHEVKFTDMYNPAFVSGCSKFESIEELFDASGFKVESKEDFEAIPDEEWEVFISQNTSFDSWLEMQKSAGAAYVKKQLGL